MALCLRLFLLILQIWIVSCQNYEAFIYDFSKFSLVLVYFDLIHLLESLDLLSRFPI